MTILGMFMQSKLILLPYHYPHHHHHHQTAAAAAAAGVTGLPVDWLEARLRISLTISRDT